MATSSELVKESVTYIPGEGDPATVKWCGHTFRANVPVPIEGHPEGSERQRRQIGGGLRQSEIRKIHRYPDDSVCTGQEVEPAGSGPGDLVRRVVCSAVSAQQLCLLVNAWVLAETAPCGVIRLARGRKPLVWAVIHRNRFMVA